MESGPSSLHDPSSKPSSMQASAKCSIGKRHIDDEVFGFQFGKVQPRRSFPPSQRETIQRNADTAQSHSSSSQRWRHHQARWYEESHCKRQADQIVAASPAEIRLDFAKARLRKGDGGSDVRQIIGLHQNNTSRFDSDVTTRHKPNAEVGGRREQDCR